MCIRDRCSGSPARRCRRPRRRAPRPDGRRAPVRRPAAACRPSWRAAGRRWSPSRRAPASAAAPRRRAPGRLRRPTRARRRRRRLSARRAVPGRARRGSLAKPTERDGSIRPAFPGPDFPGRSDPSRSRIRPLERPGDARSPCRGVDCLSPDLGGGMTRRTNLIDQAVARLRQQIISGAWPVGARIPPEPELTELIGVGRNTVREAVQSLVHAGMLERRQGSGTYVISDSELGTAMGRQIDGAHQRDVLEVRRSLEVECARLAAQRRTPAQVAELRDLRDRRAAARASGDLDVMVAADLVLHRTIAVAAKNPVLLALYENLQDAITANIRFNFEHLVGDDDAHSLLVEAIAAGDTVAAMAEIDDYLSEFIGDDPVA